MPALHRIDVLLQRKLTWFLSVQKCSSSIYTIVTVTKSSSDAHKIMSTLGFWEILWPTGTS